ncbi:MAG TPA: DUF6531 domain-containing protein [Paucimonas sp.]|nr:DUF6531 domain-containing protein [Paucimonas sp.]
MQRTSSLSLAGVHRAGIDKLIRWLCWLVVGAALVANGAWAQSHTYDSKKEYAGYTGSWGVHYGPFGSFAAAMQKIWSEWQVPSHWPGNEKTDWYAGFGDHYSTCVTQAEPPVPWNPGSWVQVLSKLNTGECVSTGGEVYIAYSCPNGGVLSQDYQTCSCPENTRYFWNENSTSKCGAVTQISSKQRNPKDNGPVPCEQPKCGQPIHPGTGNMWHTEVDYVGGNAPGALSVVRTYNSSPFNVDARMARNFGVRWTQAFDSALKQEYATQPGLPPGTCWRRNSTGETWCENPLPPVNDLPAAVSILRGDGKRYVFNRSGTAWVADADVNDRLTAEYNAAGNAVVNYTYVSANGEITELYGAATGRLYKTTTPSGVAQTFVYSNGVTNDTSAGRDAHASAPACARVHPGSTLPAGRLLCVADHWGRQLNFEYDAKGRVVKMFDPANQVYQYEYDGPSGGCPTQNESNPACSTGNLTKVAYPDGKSRTYHYNEASKINGGAACPNVTTVGNGYGHLLNALTAIVDENGARHLTWTYDCLGRATASIVGADVEKVTLSYGDYAADDTATTTVTHYVGEAANPQTTVRSYGYKMMLGRAKNTGLDQACVECGPIKARTYDANGNVASATDWNGNTATYTYDLTRNLETRRVEASGTAQARTISTQWHPAFRLPTAIAEPKRIITLTYDSLGNLLTRSEQATSDATGAQAFNAAAVGAPRVWRYTYNQHGQVLTAKGPRTDVDETTTYTYDAQGNLATVVNPAGHATTLSNYDAHGRAGRITDPNGVVTDLAYNARGWLTSRTTGGETTSYDYDGAGQLTRVTLPDGSYINYAYDEAHRLTEVTDSLGNSIRYTLDLRGNRVKEEVKDAGGALARQVSRVFDSLSRLQQVTGGAQ